MTAAFPVLEPKWIDQKTEDEMTFVQDVINAIRNIRGENNIAPSKEISVLVRYTDTSGSSILGAYDKYLKKLARVSSVETFTSKTNPKFASSAVVGGAEIFVPLEGLIDLDVERGRLEKEIARLQQVIESTNRKLSNPSFVERAPKDVVDREREKLTSFQTTLDKLKANLAHLQ